MPQIVCRAILNPELSFNCPSHRKHFLKKYKSLLLSSLNAAEWKHEVESLQPWCRFCVSSTLYFTDNLFSAVYNKGRKTRKTNLF